jgi:hypothetical protein
MKMTSHGDYETVIRFSAFSSYRVHAIFTDDIFESCQGRYITDSQEDEGTDALTLTAAESGDTHMFLQRGASAGVVAHESWHAIYAMFKWAGVKKFDNEVVAYHLGHLVDRVIDFQLKVLQRTVVKSKRNKRKNASKSNRP